MYEIDQNDQVVELAGLPQSSPGSPEPMVFASEFSIVVAYLVHDDCPFPLEHDAGEAHQRYALVRFNANAIIFGPPNDEALNGHPLYARGLRSYGAYEVLHSSWIRGLARRNAVHWHHQPERYATLRHFVLTFHDTMFECVGREYSTHGTLRADPIEVRMRMARLANTR